MRTMWAMIVACACLVGAPPAATAQDDIKVTASLSSKVASVGGEVILTVNVEGKFRRGATPQLPALDDFYVYESGTSQNFQFVNGRMSSSVIYTYVLSPQKEGTYRIDPIRVEVGGREYTANAVTLQVTAASSSVTTPAPGSAPSPGEEQAPRADLPDSDESIFITASVDHDTVYVNQQVTWTLGYYTDGRVSLLRSPNYSPPEAEGFWVEDLPPQNKYYTRAHGRRYLVNEIRRGYFPTSPGTYDIGPARVDVVIDDATSSRSLLNDLFSRPFSRGFGKQYALSTDPKTIVVLALPEAGRPDDYGGIVARDMRVSLSADKQVAQVGEPVNVTITIEGTGNMRTIPPPTLDLAEFKVYESGSSSDSFKKDYVVTGRRSYEFVVVPQAEGRRTIPALRVSYFDPVAKRYLSAESHAVPLDIQPGTVEEASKVIYAGSGDQIEVINRDIRYIHPVPSSIAMSPRSLVFSRAFVAAHALPILALAVSVVLQRRRRRLASDVGYARSSRALRHALRKLDEGRRGLSEGSTEDAYARLSEALTGYLADKMNVPRAGLTGGAVRGHLRERGVGDDEVENVLQLLAACDRARFGAGTASASEAQDTLKRARSALSSLEGRLKR